MHSLFRIKICGITTAADACAAAEAGADAIGLNFYERSPRYIQPNLAREIADALPANVAKVGVFVNSPVHSIVATAEEVGLDYIQLHGDEPPELLAQLGHRPTIKAFRCRDTDGRPVLDWLQECRRMSVRPAALLLDAYVAGQFGGTGAKLDWAAVRELSEDKDIDGLPIVLAGGLTADNVAQAIAAARPQGVDVASGVESSPGKKDLPLVEQFVANAARALRREE